MDCIDGMQEELKNGNVTATLLLDSNLLIQINDYIIKVPIICFFDNNFTINKFLRVSL